MTKDHVITIRNKFKGFPIMVTADNQRLYYSGVKDKNVIIWHDDEEVMEVLRTNIEPLAADLAPVEVVFIEYDTIQEITLYPDRKVFVQYLESIKGQLTTEEYEYAVQMLAESSKNRYSRTFAGIGLGYGPKN